MIKTFAVTAVMALVGSAALSAPVLNPSIANGGFLGSYSGPFDTLGAGNTTAMPGWTVGAAGVDHINTYWQSADGDGYSVDLSATGAGTVAQVLSNLSVGTQYVISFFMSANPAGGNATRGLTVDVGGPATGFSYTLSGGLTNMNWEARSFSFYATSASQTLKFTSLENNPYGPALDAVSISAVPLPAGGALLLSGLGGIFALRRRKA